jgi:ABC-type lipopolysaccharide export system ATPase subunit
MLFRNLHVKYISENKYWHKKQSERSATRGRIYQLLQMNKINEVRKTSNEALSAGKDTNG